MMVEAHVVRNGETVEFRCRDYREGRDLDRVVSEAMSAYRQKFYGDDLTFTEVTINIVFTEDNPATSSERQSLEASPETPRPRGTAPRVPDTPPPSPPEDDER